MAKPESGIKGKSAISNTKKFQGKLGILPMSSFSEVTLYLWLNLIKTNEININLWQLNSDIIYLRLMYYYDIS